MAKILITDDSMFMRQYLERILVRLGHEVHQAKNGEEMLDLYQQLNPDLVMLDITMPVLDGISAVKKLREIDSQASVIMCSAMGQLVMVKEAIMYGAKDFIVKPFNAEKVTESVNRILSLKEQEMHSNGGM